MVDHQAPGEDQVVIMFAEPSLLRVRTFVHHGCTWRWDDGTRLYVREASSPAWQTHLPNWAHQIWLSARQELMVRVASGGL